MRRLIVLAALALSACGGPPKDTNPLPRPPDVVGNFGQPFDARGHDPSWGLKIRGQQLTLDRPNQPDITVTAPGAVISPHQASWTGKLPDGQTMTATLYASVCSDGTGEAKYSYSAEIELPDTAPLVGCAGPPAQAMRTAKH